MIAFTSFPATQHPGRAVGRRSDDAEDELMDLDDEELLDASKLTYPGDSLTSTQAFMRSDLPTGDISGS
jgi:exosome complex component RRP4